MRDFVTAFLADVVKDLETGEESHSTKLPGDETPTSPDECSKQLTRSRDPKDHDLRSQYDVLAINQTLDFSDIQQTLIASRPVEVPSVETQVDNFGAAEMPRCELMEEDTRSSILEEEALPTNVLKCAMNVFDDLAPDPLFLSDTHESDFESSLGNYRADATLQQDGGGSTAHDLANEMEALIRSQELRTLAEQSFCARHSASRLKYSDLPNDQQRQTYSRERITCCKFERPYLGSSRGKSEYRLAELAVFALMESPRRRLTVNEIAKWICKHFSYYTDKVIESLAGNAEDAANAWYKQLRTLLKEYDFPSEPVVDNNRLKFFLPRGREWVFLQRQSTKQRTFHGFCKLPEEIRELVYFWALPLRSKTGWIVPPDYIERRHQLQKQIAPPDVRLTTLIGGVCELRSEQMRDLLSITRTNKQIHVEASRIFYGHTHFRFGEQTTKLVDGCKTLLGFLKGLNASEPSTRGAVRRITLHYNPEGQRNLCAPAFGLLLETNLRYLHIHLNEGLLFDSKQKQVKSVKGLPGFKKLTELRNVKQLTFSGMFIQSYKYLAIVKTASPGWIDPDEIARQRDQKRRKDRVADIEKRMKAKIKRASDEASAAKYRQEMADAVHEIGEASTDKLKPPRPRRIQQPVIDVFDTAYEGETPQDSYIQNRSPNIQPATKNAMRNQSKGGMQKDSLKRNQQISGFLQRSTIAHRAHRDSASPKHIQAACKRKAMQETFSSNTHDGEEVGRLGVKRLKH